MAATGAVHSVSRGTDDGGRFCLSIASHSALPSCKRKPGFVVCQAQSSSRDGSLTLDQNASPLFAMIDLQDGSEVLRRAHFFVASDRAKLLHWTEQPALLEATDDCYDGIIVDPTRLPRHANDFLGRLRASIIHWRSLRKRGIWLQLPSHLAELVPLAIKEGFQYHHAEPSHVMLTYWIPETPCTLPPNASHQVGIGAFVMNDRRQVLAVQEKEGPLRGSGIWKLPTGLINQGEDLSAGAVREVKEETGVDAQFVQIVGFRHGHFVSFGKSDLYFLCTLRPLSSAVVEQNGEIEAVRWMPLEEFRSQAFYTEHEARRSMLNLCIASWDGKYTGFTVEQLLSNSLARPSQYFYQENHSFQRKDQKL